MAAEKSILEEPTFTEGEDAEDNGCQSHPSEAQIEVPIDQENYKPITNLNGGDETIFHQQDVELQEVLANQADGSNSGPTVGDEQTFGTALVIEWTGNTTAEEKKDDIQALFVFIQRDFAAQQGDEAMAALTTVSENVVEDKVKVELPSGEMELPVASKAEECKNVRMTIPASMKARSTYRIPLAMVLQSEKMPMTWSAVRPRSSPSRNCLRTRW